MTNEQVNAITEHIRELTAAIYVVGAILCAAIMFNGCMHTGH